MFFLSRCRRLRAGKIDWVGAAGLAALIGVVLVVVWPAGAPSSPVADETRLLPLQAAGWLNAVDGDAVAGDLDGRLVVVDCWATWCPPCRAAMPHLAKLRREYGPLGVAFVGLTPEAASDRMKISDFVETVEGFDWPVGFGARPTLSRYGIRIYPTLILFGTDGRAIWSGHRAERLVEQLDLALAAKK